MTSAATCCGSGLRITNKQARTTLRAGNAIGSGGARVLIGCRSVSHAGISKGCRIIAIIYLVEFNLFDSITQRATDRRGLSPFLDTVKGDNRDRSEYGNHDDDDEEFDDGEACLFLCPFSHMFI